MNTNLSQNHRILVVDDNTAIHEDFRKILKGSNTNSLDQAEAELFGEETPAPLLQMPLYEIHSAFQGIEALHLVEKSLRENKPYAMAFMDVRMPPGWDGIETTKKLWEKDADLQVVICTAYSDYSWHEMSQELGYSDRLVILKKPFDTVEVLQLAISMTEKWRLSQQAKLRLDDLEKMVQERTFALEAANSNLTQLNVSLGLEMNARLQMEAELRQAQKLESVGRLASGVAHEINTPVQYVGDSLHFLHEAMNDLIRVVDKLKDVRQLVIEGAPSMDAALAAEALEADIDLPYLQENLPKAFEHSLEGLERVATIVRSMKEFAHPDSKEMALVDLNRAIKNTLNIAHNEYKYVAEIEADFGDLPNVTCYAGEFNQAFLNILVNAAHAIEDVVKGTDKKGIISVRTWLDENSVMISISDTGGGIPENIREKIFDPFFTTKEIGRGTGQGLAIARSVISKHKGQLFLKSTVGQGTTFFIRLPLY